MKLSILTTMAIFKFIVVSLHLMGFLLVQNSFGFQEESPPSQTMGLFDSDEVLDIRLEGNINALMKDRGADPSYHLMKLHLQNMAPEESLDLRVRVRGNFRRLKENCDTPPLKLNFKKHKAPEQSIFAGHRELKLVVPCKGERYVVREYLAYKLYNLFTDYSFNARLVRFSFQETGSSEIATSQYGFLIEDKDVLASRSHASLIERINLRPEIVEQESFLRMSVFAYMIGNTDWSIQYLHNVEMLFLKSEKVFVAVPYDFDLTGLVSSSYAKPAKALRLSSVRERVFRGYCMEDLRVLNDTFARFKELKPEVYRTITDNSLVDKKFITFAREYLDDFYDTLSDPGKITKAFSYPCDSKGTGNIVISGMQDGQP